jgi:GNAT superfamily N-acetyltransferase
VSLISHLYFGELGEWCAERLTGSNEVAHRVTVETKGQQPVCRTRWLDTTGTYRIRNVALYFARHGVLVAWPLADLAEALSAATIPNRPDTTSWPWPTGYATSLTPRQDLPQRVTADVMEPAQTPTSSASRRAAPPILLSGRESVMTSWTLAPEAFDSPDAGRLRRDYYAEVASRYWKRPVTSAEIDQGLAGDGVELLTPPTGQFVVGRYGGEAAACGGVLMLDSERAELTRVYVRPAFRGRKGASLMLAMLEDEAHTLGARQMVLNTRLDLTEARSLYVRHGYTQIPAYRTGPYMEIFYGKKLGPYGRGT